jgi:hypothetical protein
MTTRNGSAEWHGSVESGSGTITVGDGVFEGAYSYESRFGEAAGTNPEQLLAAAHSGKEAQAVGAGHPARRLDRAGAGVDRMPTAAAGRADRAARSMPAQSSSCGSAPRNRRAGEVRAQTRRAGARRPFVHHREVCRWRPARRRPASYDRPGPTPLWAGRRAADNSGV